MNVGLAAPFPWFGGKRHVSSVVWDRFGDVQSYVEPFFGSGAVLLGRPTAPQIETVNDLDGYVANFWRALRADPDAVAHHADWPANEADLHARHSWLTAQRETLLARLCGAPDFCDAKIAGWWVWGMAVWIGGGFCSGDGPWIVHDGMLVRRESADNAGRGVKRQLVHLGDAGHGVQRKRVHLGDAGQGDPGIGECGILDWMRALAARLARVRICCGDWSRICGNSVTVAHGTTAVFLDPPYSDVADRDAAIYIEDSLDVAHDVRAWCVEWGGNPLMRIALCGYVGEHEALAEHGWTPHFWTARGGYANLGNGRGKENRKREVIWFSPHCLPVEARHQQLDLLALEAES